METLSYKSQDIYNAALGCGFNNCGIIPISYLDGFEELLKERIKNVPESAEFYKNFERFLHVKELYSQVKSAIICTYDYSKYRYPEPLRKRYAKPFFFEPEKGRNDGYDKNRFEKLLTGLGINFVKADMSLFPYRYAAEKAGLGIIRNNNFFYAENGCYVALIGYLTDCDCTLIQDVKPRPCSPKCNLCQNACKTHALSAPHTMNPMKCVSFWTTFGKGQVPPYLCDEMYEQWLCGCDNCMDACPHNHRHNWDEGESFSDLEEIAPEITPDKVLEKSDDYLIEHVIAKTDNHLQPDEVSVLRLNTKRAIKFCEKNGLNS